MVRHLSGKATNRPLESAERVVLVGGCVSLLFLKSYGEDVSALSD
jgi:hypothetical protein